MRHSMSNCRQWTVSAQLPIRYDVIEADNLFTSDQPSLLSYQGHSNSHSLRRLVVIDRRVNQHYGTKIRQYFHRHGIRTHIVVLSVSEREKTIATVFKILAAFSRFGLSRRCEPVIAIGGGVLLDIVGLAASLYRRGIPYIRIPTTLLSLVDAGVGIKVGVNLNDHKSGLGDYYAPLAVFLDIGFLTTLPKRQLCNGLAEIIKIAVVKDKKLFQLLELHGQDLVRNKFQNRKAALPVIRRAIQGMLEELEPNLWEKRLERLVDFGHTFTHSVEMLAMPVLLHGEAVAIDMALSACISYKRSLLSETERDRILNLIRMFQLPVFNRVCTSALLFSALRKTMQHRDRLQRCPIPIRIGSAVFVNDITSKEIGTALVFLKQYAQHRRS